MDTKKKTREQISKCTLQNAFDAASLMLASEIVAGIDQARSEGILVTPEVIDMMQRAAVVGFYRGMGDAQKMIDRGDADYVRDILDMVDRGMENLRGERKGRDKS